MDNLLMEKEKIEIEAQKKLIDIIFKNRTTTGAFPSVLDDAVLGANKLVIDPVDLLGSIGVSTAATNSGLTSTYKVLSWTSLELSSNLNYSVSWSTLFILN